MKNNFLEKFIIWVIINIVLWLVVGVFYLLVCFVLWDWLLITNSGIFFRYSALSIAIVSLVTVSMID